MNNNEILKINQEQIKEKQIKIIGNKILQENTFLNQLHTVMQDDNFRPFYDKYFKDSTDIKIVILYLKLYETIEKEYKERNGTQIDGDLLILLVQQLMTDNKTRKFIMNEFSNFFDSNTSKKKYLLDLIKDK